MLLARQDDKEGSGAVALKPLCTSLGHWSQGLDHGLES